MKVWYFSSMAFLYEIVAFVFISILLAMILTNVLGSIITGIFSALSTIFNIILFIVKWVLIIGIILFVGAFIIHLFSKGKSFTKDENIFESNNSETSEGWYYE